MSTNKAKVAATLYGTVRHSANDEAYCVKLMLEYVVLYGTTYRAAKFPVEVMNPRNESDLRDAVKDYLVAYLNTKYAPEHFATRDVMLFGL